MDKASGKDNVRVIKSDDSDIKKKSEEKEKAEKESENAGTN